MTSADHPALRVRLATDDAGAAEIDRIFARRRAELARLGLSARSAVRRCEAAERQLAERATEDGAPTDLLTVIDTMIERAVRERDDVIAAARRAADETVGRAVADSVEDLRRAGVDTSRLPAARRPASSTVRLTSAPSAGELWSRVGAPHVAARRASVSLARSADEAVLPADPTAVELTPDAAVTTPFATRPDSSLPAPEGLEELVPATVVTLLVEPTDDRNGGTGTASEDAEFDSFWREASQERRVRDRFRRRGKEDA